MPAYKDETNNTWYCQFYYTDWKGNKKKKLKRGFQTKKQAKVWEVEFQKGASADMDMTFASFTEIYFQDKSMELKERTIKSKRYIVNTHLLPYFANRKMNEITPSTL